MNGQQKLVLYAIMIGAVLACFLGILYAPTPQ